MVASRKRGNRTGKRGRRGKKDSFLIDGGRFFFLSGLLAILCVLLLFVTVLYGGGHDDGTSASGGSPLPQASDRPSASVPVTTDSSTDSADRPLPAASVPVATEPPLEIRPQEVISVSDLAVPPAREGARLTFVIDDAGQNLAALRRYLAVPLPLAVAVLPQLPLTKEAASMVTASGKELMLHQPMQAEKLSLWAGPGSVMPDMALGEIKALVTANLQELGPGVRGMNNHEGSLITRDEVRIGAVLDVARDYGVFFLDSRTTAATKVPEAARIRGMRILERDVFIDNVLERKAMLAQIYEGLALANKQGTAIMIGHVDKSADVLPALLTELAPVLQERGYLVVPPSRLLED